MTQDDVASLVLATAAAARAYAPDLRAGLRRLLGAGVRLGAESLMDQRATPVTRPDTARHNDSRSGQ
ncbi:hypothetical protein [Streptomyces sp. NBC_00566]|uniref:hypothetical protein n=1 Tax=Streptomyces sp. NBC_00566 TaxID=2975778 RepID=UPI002E80FF93|nr:hypothetical protein [Streptomyces sp. NBC_00566]WUB90302.1 hypothetical protein OG812_28480 [Streptomyces sp. NBC_00566]